MSTVSWRGTVDRATMACLGFVLAVQVAVCCSALASSSAAWPHQDLVRVGTVACCDLALLVGCVVLVGRPAWLGAASLGWGASVVAMAALIVAGGIAAPSPLPDSALQIVPVNTIQTVQFAVVGFGLTFRRGAAIILASGPLYVALREGAAGSGALHAVDEWMLPAVSSLAVLAILDHLRSGADAADQLAAAAHDAARSAASRTNAEIAREEARRVVHDDVISALRAAELGLEPDLVREASGSALGSLAGRRSLTTLEELEQDLRRVAPVELVVDATDWAEPPPPRVLGILRDAAAEALRNAARHGGAQRVELRLRSSGVETEVVLTDDGVGLAPGWRMGFGLRESIVGRLAEIAGEAEIGPADDGGTRVRLRWPAAARSTARTADPVVRDRSHAARAVALACAAGTVYTSLRFPGDPPALGFAVAVAILAALALAALRVGRPPVPGRGPLRGPALGLIAAGLCALVWTGLEIAGDGALLSTRSWVIGSAANVMAILAFDVAGRRIAPVLAALVLTVVAFAVHDPTIAVTEPLGSVATPVVVVGMAALLGAALRHGERLIAAGRVAVAVEMETAAWEQTATESRRRYLTHLEDDVVPFLELAAGTGAADPARARLLSARCRDDLYLVSPLDATTRQAVQSARQRGVTVTLRPGPHDPDRTWPTLRLVLAVAPAGSAVTVLPPAGFEPGRIVATPALSPDALPLAGNHDALRSTFTLSSPLSSPLSSEAVTAGHGARETG